MLKLFLRESIGKWRTIYFPDPSHKRSANKKSKIFIQEISSNPISEKNLLIINPTWINGIFIRLVDKNK